MTKKQFEKLFVQCINSLRRQTFVPYDTGNLKFNAIKGYWKNDHTFTIYIDENVAPYVYFTNEPWTSEKWNGKKNPNEAWVEKMVNYIATYIAKHLKGEIQK